MQGDVAEAHHQRGGGSSSGVGAMDIEAGEEKPETERECRICHLSLDAGNHVESGVALAIELGCSCKDDLGAAHKLCAEAWFKIKGDKTCEICGSTARNVAGANEVEPPAARPNDTSNMTAAEASSFLQGEGSGKGIGSSTPCWLA